MSKQEIEDIIVEKGWDTVIEELKELDVVRRDLAVMDIVEKLDLEPSVSLHLIAEVSDIPLSSNLLERLEETEATQ
jgi:hypothetical protein